MPIASSEFVNTEFENFVNDMAANSTLLYGVKRYSTSITGTGSQTAFAITHNLNSVFVWTRVLNSSNVEVTTGYTVTRTSNNVNTLTFSTAPASGVTYNVYIIGC